MLTDAIISMFYNIFMSFLLYYKIGKRSHIVFTTLIIILKIIKPIKICGGYMIYVYCDDSLLCESCSFIIRGDGSEDFSEMDYIVANKYKCSYEWDPENRQEYICQLNKRVKHGQPPLLNPYLMDLQYSSFIVRVCNRPT